MGAVGTVTYVTARPYTRSAMSWTAPGRRSLLLQDAYVYYVVNNPDPTDAAELQARLARATPWARSRATPRTRSSVSSERRRPTSRSTSTAHDLDTGHSLALAHPGGRRDGRGAAARGPRRSTRSRRSRSRRRPPQIYDGPPAQRVGEHVPAHLPARAARRRWGSATATWAPECRATPAWCHRSWRAPPRPTWPAHSARSSMSTSRRCTSTRWSPMCMLARPGDGRDPRRRRRPARVRAGSRSGYGSPCGSTAARADGRFRLRIPVGRPGRDPVTLKGPPARRAWAPRRHSLGRQPRASSLSPAPRLVGADAGHPRRSPRWPRFAPRSPASPTTTGVYANYPDHGKRPRLPRPVAA